MYYSQYFLVAAFTISILIKETSQMRQSVFGLFNHCTINFVHSEYSSLLLHNVETFSSLLPPYLKYCQESTACVSIHFNLDLLVGFQNESFSRSLPRAETQLALSEYIGKILEHINILDEYLKRILPRQKHSVQICTVQFPQVATINGTIHFSHIDNVLYLSSHQRDSRQTISALQKIALMPITITTQPTVLVSVYLSSRLIFVDLSSRHLYLPYLALNVKAHSKTSVDTNEETYLTEFSLVSFPVSIKDARLTDIDKFYWKFFTRTKNHWTDFKATSDIYQVSKPTEDTIRSWKHVHFFSIVKEHLNCSKSFVAGSRFMIDCEDEFEQLSFLKRIEIPKTSLLPYGQPINEGGDKFVILLGNREQAGSVKDLVSFLQPFGWKIWFACALTCFCIGAIAIGSNSKQRLVDISLWLFTTLLEQGDDGRSLATKIVSAHLVLWLLFGNFLRNFYTSDLYTDIAVPPVPTWLPKSLDHINHTETNAGLLKVMAISLSLFLVYPHLSMAEIHDIIALRPVQDLTAETNVLVFYSRYHEYDVVMMRHLPVLAGDRTIFVNNMSPVGRASIRYGAKTDRFHNQIVSNVIGDLHSSGIVYHLDKYFAAAYFEYLISDMVMAYDIDSSLNYKRYAREYVESEFNKVESGMNDIEYQKIIPERHRTSANDDSVSISDISVCWLLYGLSLSVTMFTLLAEFIREMYLNYN